jgi:hypothetical protein
MKLDMLNWGEVVDIFFMSRERNKDFFFLDQILDIQANPCHPWGFIFRTIERLFHIASELSTVLRHLSTGVLLLLKPSS